MTDPDETMRLLKTIGSKGAQGLHEMLRNRGTTTLGDYKIPCGGLQFIAQVDGDDFTALGTIDWDPIMDGSVCPVDVQVRLFSSWFRVLTISMAVGGPLEEELTDCAVQLMRALIAAGLVNKEDL